MRRVSPCKHHTLQPPLHTHFILPEGGSTQGLSLGGVSVGVSVPDIAAGRTFVSFKRGKKKENETKLLLSLERGSCDFCTP